MCSDHRLSVCRVQTAALRRPRAVGAMSAAPRRQAPSRRRQVPEPLTPQSRQVIVRRRRSHVADYNTLKLAKASPDRNLHGQLKRDPSLSRARSR